MSKLLASILVVVCFAWVSICTWWLSNEHKQTKPDPSLTSASLSIMDASFKFEARDIFSFHQSDATPVIPADNLTLLQALAVHLGENPDRELELTGLYSTTERNTTPYPNLGIARAKAIEKLLVEFAAPPEQLVTSAELVQNLYMYQGRILGGVNFVFNSLEKDSGEEPETAEEDQPTDQSAADEILPSVTTKAGERVYFYPEKGYRLDEANRPFLDSLRRVLRVDQRKTVILSGFSQAEEEKEVVGNLAELRAKSVRRYLVDNGVRRKQIIVVSHPGSAKDDKDRRVEIKVEKD